MLITNKIATAAAFALAASFQLYTLPAVASWPERPVKLVVPFAAGGLTDVTARITAERLRQTFNQSFIVENEAGATGTLAAQRVARSDPDGYTLFFCATNQIAIAPFTHAIGYDPIKDFKVAGLIATTPFVIAIGEHVPAKTLEQFISYVKSKPAKFTYGSSGIGSLSHLASAAFFKAIKIEAPHVAYRGIAPAFQDLLAGHVDMVSASPVELKPQLEGGKVRALATVDFKRSSALPNVPVIGDLAPGVAAVNWSGIMAPAGTPDAIVNVLAKAIAAMTKDPSFVEQLEKIGVDAGTGTPEEFKQRILTDMERWRVIVEDLGLGKAARRPTP